MLNIFFKISEVYRSLMRCVADNNDKPEEKYMICQLYQTYLGTFFDDMQQLEII